MPTPAPMTPEQFLAATKVNQIVDDIKTHFKTNNKQLTISDVTDAQGNQYVDLVQEGGGVLGIALVGYTYVLEKMGIRFFSMAGTSAGSINAMLLACAGNKEDEKSEKIVDHLIRLQMFSFVDGKPGNSGFNRWLKNVVERLLMGKNLVKRITTIIKWILGSFLLLTIASIVLNFIWPALAKWTGVAAIVVLLISIVGTIVIIKRFKEFSKNGYGLNQGDEFHKWIKQVIETCYIENDKKNGTIKNYACFSKHFMRVPVLKVKEDKRRTNNTAPRMPMLTIITCDIVAKRKIEFPLMWDLYWKKHEDVHPGDFVRASMSIPVFFETFCRDKIQANSSYEFWDKHLNWQNEKRAIPDFCQFIDGGTLSNFPINVFYNPKYPVPRMPTLGIRLQDGILDAVNKSNNSFLRYIASLFTTIRFNFDRDFITKNRAYNMGVKNIDVQKHSWLNFFMKDEEKVELFRKGALAAAEFLKSFDWEKYKDERLRNFEMNLEKINNPNNMEVKPEVKVV
ncbi:MAG TPA: patatin-like phospholipase family protein [Chitinophagaceae bacterium]